VAKNEGIREKYRDPDLVKVKTNLKGLSKIVKREATDGPFGITISLAKNEKVYEKGNQCSSDLQIT